MRGTGTGTEVWSQSIQQVAPYTHRLAGDPGVGRLSKLELAKLDEVLQRYWWIDDDDLSKITQGFPEWRRNAPPPKGVRPIPTEHVLEAIGLADDAERLRREARADAQVDATLTQT